MHPPVGVDKMDVGEKVKWEQKRYGDDGVKVDGMVD